MSKKKRPTPVSIDPEMVERIKAYIESQGRAEGLITIASVVRKGADELLKKPRRPYKRKFRKGYRTVIISTLGYRHEPVIRAAQTFFDFDKPEKVDVDELIILHNFPQTRKVNVDAIIKKIETGINGNNVRINVLPTFRHSIRKLVKVIRKLVRGGSELNDRTIINLAGGAQKLTIAALIASYLEFDKLDKLTAITKEDDTLVELPLIPWPLDYRALFEID